MTETASSAALETATLGGGCFWCLEAVFDAVKGVHEVESGYAGGSVEHPTYAQVCGGRTGHAEVVRIRFDPSIVSYRDLLDIFFVIHDPTTLNRQGNDVGTQYRSAIYTHSEQQRSEAQAVIDELEAAAAFPDPIVTEVRPAGPFWRAEDGHQEYFARNPRQPYCQFVVAPKMGKFREKFRAKMKA